MGASFSVSPMIHKISLKPGDVYRGRILVANPLVSTEDFYYKASLHPYSINDSNGLDFENQTDWSKIANWITLENESGVLKPNDIKEINFTITVPENPPSGGQYAMIAVTQDTEKAISSGSGVSNVYEMASLIYAEIEGETTHNCTILENSATGFVSTGAPSVTMRLSNQGNIHETAYSKLSSKNVFTGETVDYTKEYGEGLETLVMPTSERTVTRELEGLPQLGIFEVTQEVRCLDDVSTVSTIMIICPIWFMALCELLLLTLIGTILGIVFHKRKQNHIKTIDF